MVSPTHRHEFGWTPGVGDRQGSLGYCGSWGRKESDTTEQLNWTELRDLSSSQLILSTSLIWPYVHTSLISSACYIHTRLLAITLDNEYIENPSLQEVLLGISGINNCRKYYHEIESKTKNFLEKKVCMSVYIYIHTYGFKIQSYVK